MRRTILLFDANCMLCSRLVQFLLPRGKNIEYTSLQSITAKKLLEHDYNRIMTLNTLVLLENKKFYFKSTAVIKVILKMHGLWPLLSIFRIVPLFIRDKLYDIVAKNRYSLFGQCENCVTK